MHPDREACATTNVLFEGTLVANAHFAHEAVDDSGALYPVIVMEIESDRGMHMPLRIKQRFPAGHAAQAEAAARRYRKGQHVQVQASALSVRLSCVASHIHTLNDQETEPCPASPSSP